MTNNIESLVLAYKENNSSDTFELIYQHYLPKFETKAKHDEDLISEYMIALIKAIDSYEPNPTYKFNTHLWLNVKNVDHQLRTKKYAKKRSYFEVPYGLAPFNEVYYYE